MVDAMLLSNLVRWSLQVALLCATVWILIRLLRVDVPTIRHALWRGVLVVSLLLPFVQPRAVVPAPAGITVDMRGLDLPALSPPTTAAAAVDLSLTTRLVRAVRASWLDIAFAILAAGVVGRLLWLAIGYFNLRLLRRGGDPVDLAEVQCRGETAGDLSSLRVDVRYVSRLGQPVTFGFFRPVVLLPDSCRTLGEPLRRAILTHELWHVCRRDWGWLIGEEILRAVFWFNPAMWWLVTQVQSTREEVVDELTVLATNGRRAYLEALLTFADEPTLFPAAPFARRRHLFRRMLLISREAVMSSRRVVLLSVVACAAIIGSSWYGAASFPLQAAAPAGVVPAGAPPVSTAAPASPAQAASTQAPPRDRRPGEAAPETTREIELKRAIESNPENANQWAELVRLQEGRGAIGDALSTLEAMRQAFPSSHPSQRFVAGTYLKLGRSDEGIAVVEEIAASQPSDKQLQLMAATFYLELVSKGQAVPPDQTAVYLKKGVDATNRALAIDPDYVDALAFKAVILRRLASVADPTTQQALIAEADAARTRAMELKSTTATMAFQPAPGHGTATLTPHQFTPLIDGMAPVRVGGSIKPPVKTRDVKPVYPPVARDAGVQGVVIIEAGIDSQGNVVTAHVLRGQPLLDQAALDAVRQWTFRPTQLNGAPVPVIMTVTVNFTHSDGPTRSDPLTATQSYPPPPPPPPPAPVLVDGLEPFRVGGAIKPPVKITNVAPVYPADALAAKVGGVVILQATIDTAGNVVAAKVLRGNPMLDQAAIDAVEQWKFEPTLVNGAPVPLIMTVTVSFTAQ